MKYVIRIALLLLVIPVLLFASIDNLPSIIQGVLIDEMSRNTTIDSLNKLIIERAVWDTLNALGADTINVGHIVGLDIDFSIRESGSDTFIDVTIQVVYDRSGATQQAVDPFIRDRQSIVLSTTHQRMIQSFTIEVDNNLFIAETEVQEGFNTVELEEETVDRRSGIFLVVENGVNRGYSYRDIEARAFENRRLTDVNLPDGIQSIGARAFANNRLSVINIPHSVTSIEASAFVNNRPTMVSIGENVQLGKNAIGRGFETFYNRNDRRAGIYVYERGNWSWGLSAMDN